MQNKESKEFKHKGRVYVGMKNNGKVKVAVRKTANGQLINLSIYDINAKTWQDISRKQKVPPIVKHGVEITFVK